VRARTNSFRTRRATGKLELGASLVEYAFILIIFLGIVLGIGGFGHAMFTYHHLNNAAKEGTRYASVRGSTCLNDGSCTSVNSASGISGPTTTADVTAYLQRITPASIDTSKMAVSACGVGDATPVTCTDSTPAVCSVDVKDKAGNVIQVKTPNYPGCTVQVAISYPYNFMFPLLPSVTTTTAPCTSAGLCISTTSEMIIVH